MIGGVTPGTSTQRRPDLAGKLPQLVQVVAENLDGDLGVDAGEHVADQVRERLLDLDLDARHFGPQVGQHRFQELVAARAAVRVHGQDVLADVDRLGVFVQFGPARAAGEVQDRAVGVLRRLLHRLRACDRSRPTPRSTPRATSRPAARR